MKVTAALPKGSAFRKIERRVLSSYKTTAIPSCAVRCQQQRIWKPEPFVRRFSDDKKPSHKKSRQSEFEDEAKRLNAKGTQLRDEDDPSNTQVDEAIAGEFEEKQARTPWHREGPETSPVENMERPPRPLAKGMSSPMRTIKRAKSTHTDRRQANSLPHLPAYLSSSSL